MSVSAVVDTCSLLALLLLFSVFFLIYVLTYIAMSGSFKFLTADLRESKQMKNRECEIRKHTVT